ncbi:MAG: DUF2974 domain-containing protein [Lachnospiraceae bacterium]|nr:DUF2974 domain-containing protein [Candidatus Equihabitans merdae]
MANMMDYLRWRGDLSFTRDPFNEVDNLILSHLSYVLFKREVPGIGNEPRPLYDVSKRFFMRHTEEELKRSITFTKDAPFLMQEMAKTVRFGDLLVGNFVDDVDEANTKQFSALTIGLPDGSTYVSYRGTDDNLVSWKEDMNLGMGVVPSEQDAVSYLNKIGEITEGPLYIGGHSKGGNLAVYAAAYASDEVKNRIVTIFSNDGPGFLQEINSSASFVSIKNKVKRYLPSGSVIGMILKHSAPPIFLKSSNKGLMEHDGFSWQVEGTHFVYADGPENISETFNKSLQSWLDSVDDKQKAAFIDEIFSLASAGGAKTLTDLQENKFKTLFNIAKDADEISDESRNLMKDFFHTVIQDFEETLPLHNTLTKLGEDAKAAQHLIKEKAEEIFSSRGE